jgi:hypothetical protein
VIIGTQAADGELPEELQGQFDLANTIANSDTDKKKQYLNVDSSIATKYASQSPSHMAYLPELEKTIAGKTLVMTATAIGETLTAIEETENDVEKARLSQFLTKALPIPDLASSSYKGLTPSNQLGENDIKILGTGDALGIPTYTADKQSLDSWQGQIGYRPANILAPGGARLVGK